ncbi:response regulator [Rugamonas apoptosis]|uniref:Response regulator n=1 Tax=Rugamonas apoptosis TaxID=2758570 RepID=A0A7W2F7S0_9BURK|nr:response regulator [Rugamonas apoptosis]MBA5686634.1 response regulator [Rugamonas apoptosis]
MAASILVIEDNPANMNLMVYLLEAYGYRVLSAWDGEQGVAAARRERPDLVLCDLRLPRLDGYGVLRQLKADPATRAIPVLAASAEPADDGGAALLAAGFDGVLAKAFEPEQLLPALAAWLPAPLRTAHMSPPAPAVDVSDYAAPDATPVPGIAPLARARVLLLDAAPANRGLLASVLGPLGYPLTVAANGSQAEACASQAFDLVLCDCDGEDEAALQAFPVAALRRLEHLPLVVLRPALDDSVAWVPGGRRYPARLLAHPIEPKKLVDEIAACLAAAQPAA